MYKHVLALATVGMIAIGSASAQDVRFSIGRDHDAYKERHHDHHDRGWHYGWRHRDHNCRTVVIKERHHGEVVIRRERRCD